MMKKIFIPIAVCYLSMLSAQRFEEVGNLPFKHMYYTAAAVGDYNNDGTQDIFFTGAVDLTKNYEAETTKDELYNNKNGVFELAQEFPKEQSTHAGGVKFIDFDNDGLLDIVMNGMNYGDGAATAKHLRYKNNGDTFTLIDELPGKVNAVIGEALEVFDYNHDGLQDYALNGTENSHDEQVGAIDIYTNSQKGFNKQANWIPNVPNGNFKVFDFDNDNELDIAISGTDAEGNASFKLYKNIGGQYALHQELSPVYEGKINYADFNADGFQDIVVSGSNNDGDNYIAVYLNDGQGRFQQSFINKEDGLSASSVDVGDINFDGYYDFAVIGANSDYNNTLNIFTYNPKTNNFVKLEDANLIPLGGNGGVQFIDYNGDNQLDILIHGLDLSNSKAIEGKIKLYQNTSIENHIPTAPNSLTSKVVGDKVLFEWSGATDDKTPKTAFRYEISVGSQPNKADIAKYEVTTPNWYLKKENLPSKIYWSVRAIDSSKSYSLPSKQEEISTLAVQNVASHRMDIYPNPVRDRLNIRAEEGVKAVYLYNAVGQRVAQQDNTNTINVESLSKGIYLLEVIFQNGEVAKQKIIKN